jgi:uncharacterized protein YabN with tetrapyrrole methylase and pyrophosphatase domain
MGPRGSLTVVGLGFLGIGQVTPESLSYITAADKLFEMVGDPASRFWLQEQNASAESLYDAYAPGKPRTQSYGEMVERILQPVREGLFVCAAFYGHPGVFVHPSHEAIRARAEGHEARMLPGISAEDCLFADLHVDPARHGCASFEATEFLCRPRTFDTSAALILWQVGAIGVATYEKGLVWGGEGLHLLTKVLLERYPADHEVVVYEAAMLAIEEPRIVRTPLRALASAPVTVFSTLYVPPARDCPVDHDLVRRLGMTPPAP